MLKGFAHKGDYSKLMEVINLLKESHVKLNIQSYVYILECLGRINVENKYITNIKHHIALMLQDGNDFNVIMNEGTFYDGQRELVLKAMRAHTPTYEPKYSEPNIGYSNQLVNHLNTEYPLDDQPVQSGSLFSAESLAEATKKQIELERYGYVTVSNLEFLLFYYNSNVSLLWYI